MRSRDLANGTVALTATVVATLPSCAPIAVRAGAGTIVVNGGTLIGGTGSAPLPGATIVVRAGRVTEVTAGGVAGPGAGIDVIDARGKWIVPGLIDMHVHYQPGWMDALFLRHGVTTVRDVGAAGLALSSCSARTIGPPASRAPGSSRAGP